MIQKPSDAHSEEEAGLKAGKMEEKADNKEIVFDSVTWEAQKYDAVERKFQEVCPRDKHRCEKTSKLL
jgi:hypothetical protein